MDFGWQAEVAIALSACLGDTGYAQAGRGYENPEFTQSIPFW
ncbi:MAG: hypothetical protein WBA57_23455 [Elainellaceae cyanobacterium]